MYAFIVGFIITAGIQMIGYGLHLPFVVGLGIWMLALGLVSSYGFIRSE